jgi:hypothetical protein
MNAGWTVQARASPAVTSSPAPILEYEDIGDSRGREFSRRVLRSPSALADDDDGLVFGHLLDARPQF